LSLAAFLLIGTLPGDPARFLLGSALALLLGLSGNDIRRWGLEQRGYALVHVYAARDSEEALLRLLNERTDVAARYRAATA
jgi:hypothetical protein